VKKCLIILIIVMLLLTAILVILSETVDKTQEPTMEDWVGMPSVRDEVIYIVKESPNYEISADSGEYPTMEDIARYEQIMDTIWKMDPDMEKSDDELFSILAPTEGMTAVELGDYIYWVMPYATGLYDLPGKPEPPSFDELTGYVKMTLEDLIKEKVIMPISEENWEINQVKAGSNTRYIIKANNIKIGTKENRNIIIKMEFNVDYTVLSVFQLKINGYNFPL